jgi:hypothetical protein
MFSEFLPEFRWMQAHFLTDLPANLTRQDYSPFLHQVKQRQATFL